MKWGIRFWIVLSIITPITAWGMPPDYEPRAAARPVTLPTGMLEAGVGVKPDAPPYHWSSLNNFFQFRYGITDNLEFIPVGLKYRILNDTDGNTEAAIAFSVPQFEGSTYSGGGNPSGTSYRAATSAKGEIKQTMLGGDLALRGSIHSFSQQRYGDTAGLYPLSIAYAYEGGCGITHSLLSRGSITIDAYYQKINGAEITDANQTNIVTETVEVVLGVLGLEYNSSRFDLRAEYFYGSGTRSFHSNNYRDYGKSGYSAIATVRF